jgi:endonuclease-8
LPEGHTVHRIANDFNRLFAKQVVSVTSPQGRFSEGAQLISGRTLIKAKAIGKQMFLQFDNQLTLRVHLGIYGKWNVVQLDGDELPQPTGQVRARFSTEDYLADLRGPTVCEVLTKTEVKAVEKRLGPDPLNLDPKGVEQARFVQKVLGSKTPIGLLLMNQDVIAGIGNVYRAEILFRANLDPHRPGNELQSSQVEAIWRDAVDLLKVGVKTGFMITRDELRTKRPSKAERNFVYKREGLPCRICKTNISIEIMAARKLYFCVSCQPA